MTAQRTIAREARVAGIGLHSGEPCSLVFKPAPPDSGMVFVRTDLPGRPSLTAHPSLLCQRQRRTALADRVDGRDVEVHTTEHLLAAATSLGIDNLIVELDAVELPGLDGSALEFGKALRSAGTVEQATARQSFELTEAVTIDDGKASIIALPYKDGLRITYTLDDHGGALDGPQMVELELTEDTFFTQIAPARTFCTAKEVAGLRALGLGKGATYQNTCVWDGTRIIDNELRFKDEAARHKVLDLIGDLALATRRINAHIIAVRSGHAQNMLLVQELNRRIERASKPRFVFDISRILDLLPHRYPLLMVDRVLDWEEGKRITAIKNVTINEPYFQGHFPGNPVMPGVLQVEAMAQTGAILLMTAPENRGRIPYFMSMDKVKFRRAIHPGDQMRIEVEALRFRSRMAACLARVTVDGQLCAEAEIRSVLVDAPADPAR
ncbi:MAG: UDP-3-O-[3-hydroxymyristoyl] N-acetylglucosamine deacetylase [Planctomycetes bacterium]|nr:UDP-3-O-[3-hydroxymyristoyl] N-acetylglucosamine deacetylase [Planctomycetota bacterium]